MLNRFPNSSLQPQAYIALYRLYTQNGQVDSANYYRDLMAQMYPNIRKYGQRSTQVLLRFAGAGKAIEGAYTAALYQYSQGNHGSALQMAENVISNEPNNPLLPQYYLLKTLSIITATRCFINRL